MIYKAYRLQSRLAESSDCNLTLRPIAMLGCVRLQLDIASDRKVMAMSRPCIRQMRETCSTSASVRVVVAKYNTWWSHSYVNATKLNPVSMKTQPTYNRRYILFKDSWNCMQAVPSWPRLRNRLSSSRMFMGHEQRMRTCSRSPSASDSSRSCSCTSRLLSTRPRISLTRFFVPVIVLSYSSTGTGAALLMSVALTCCAR